MPHAHFSALKCSRDRGAILDTTHWGAPDPWGLSIACHSRLGVGRPSRLAGNLVASRAVVVQPSGILRTDNPGQLLSRRGGCIAIWGAGIFGNWHYSLHQIKSFVALRQRGGARQWDLLQHEQSIGLRDVVDLSVVVVVVVSRS